jgi:LPXTG-motif cell wall-anchored protein
MQTDWLVRITAMTAFGAAAALAAATPAWASSNIAINPGNVPTTAAAFEQECSGNLGGGPYQGKDVWVFNLPGNHDTTGDFLSVVAQFDTNGDNAADTSITIEDGADDGDDIVTIGTSKAWVVTDAGWTLVGATATISGTATQFVLTHTCAASGGSTPTPNPSGSPSGSPSESPSGNPSEQPSMTPSNGTGGEGGDQGGLPLTGTAVGGIVGVGLVLVGAGAGLLVLRRRRRFVA